ncbi:MAG: hypothetical protein WBM04_11745 [Candidatus Korobacteraceae bacterium]
MPALAAQVTDELKFPVPVTLAEHWLVCPYMMVEGEQVTVTDVIEDDPPPPLLLEPQATIHNALDTASSIPSLLTLSSP